MRALRQFWSQGTRSKVVVLVTAAAIVLIGGFSVLLIGSSLSGGNTQAGGNNSTGGGTQNTTTAKGAATASSAAEGTATAAANAEPRLGSLMANFVTVYGQPTQQPHVQQSPGTDAFWGNAQQTVLIDVHFTNGVADHIAVVGPASSTDSQTFNACAAFLPPDATSYSSTPPDTYYHSSVGNLVLENDDSGLCSVYVA